MDGQVKVIDLDTQCCDRKTFALYFEDGDFFLSFRGQSTFESLKDFENAFDMDSKTYRNKNSIKAKLKRKIIAFLHDQ